MSTFYSFDDVSTRRQTSQPLAKTIAPVVSSDMYKSPLCFEKPASKDFTQLLSLESRSRFAATLKASGGMLRHDTISLGTGRPSARYFPFLELGMTFPSGPDFSGQVSHTKHHATVGKHDIQDRDSSIDLAVVLNYGYGAGSEQLLRFVTEHMEVVHNPPYSNWHTSLTAGSTSALDGVLRMFCTRGDFILTEQYTYSGALEAVAPLGVKTAAIKMDQFGLIPEALDDILSTWDPAARGANKPFLLYTIPTGQNPSGVTQTLERRKAIYSIAEKHNLYIIEDDPYYYLQFDQQSDTTEESSFVQNLLPSYLSMDISGRVLRLDSTSKTLAPGLRCGWMTGSSQIIERLLYFHDVSSVSPSGLSQLAVYKLLEEAWGHSGFVNWLLFLRKEYSLRSDTLIQACKDFLPQSVCSWNTTRAGMFHWLKIDWKAHPYAKGKGETLCPDDLLEVEDRIYSTALEYGVMCCKGSTFCAGADKGMEMFFRTTFATATLPQLAAGMERFGNAIRKEFGIL